MAIREKDKKSLIADFFTGKYSQRDLAYKYSISLGSVNKLTKNLEPKNEHLVNAQVSIFKAKEELEDLEMNAIMNTAKEIANFRELINSASSRNIALMAKKINEGSSILEHKIAQDAIDKASITLGVNQRHAPKAEINNTNAQQNSETTITFKRIEK